MLLIVCIARIVSLCSHCALCLIWLIFVISDQQTEGPTNGWTDRVADRVACTRLKTTFWAMAPIGHKVLQKEEIFLPSIRTSVGTSVHPSPLKDPRASQAGQSGQSGLRPSQPAQGGKRTDGCTYRWMDGRTDRRMENPPFCRTLSPIGAAAPLKPDFNAKTM